MDSFEDSAARAEEVRAPAVIPDHKLLRLIGKGSYGEVWLARSTLGACRAVKIVYQATFRDKRPFERELSGVQKFEPVSRLHEGLMDILQVGRNQEAGYFYCVMELADDIDRGQAIDPANYTPRTLARELARQKRLSFETCLQVGLTMSSALSFLHGRGLIHRDVKPSNIVFVNGVPKLADIGLVAEMSEARSYVGTEGLIPPEGPGTVQADLYSLGKVLYEISTGKDRYEYPELPTVLDDTTHDRDLLALNKIILKACRAEPRQRFRSAEELHRDLVALRVGQGIVPQSGPGRLRNSARLAGATIVLAMLVLLAARLHRPSQTHAAHPPPGVETPKGLVGWWRAEDSGTNSVGASQPAVLTAISYAPGKVGRAFGFDGLTSAITVPASSNLAVQSFSIEAWIFPVDVNLERPIVEYAGETGPLSVQLWYNEAVVPGGGARIPGALYALLRGEDGSALQVSTEPGLIPVLQWTHVGLTFDYSNSTALLYVNGVVRGSNSLPFPINVRTHVPVHFGYRPENSGELWGGRRHLGLLDEVSIYNRALSSAEIRSIYDAGSLGKRASNIQPIDAR